MSEDRAILALDIGTSRIKCGLVSQSGQLLTGAFMRNTSVDPHALMQGVSEVIDETVAGIEHPIDAVAVSCFWHGLLMVDADGAPLGSISTWQDTSATDSTLHLRALIDPDEYHLRTGCFIHSSYPMTRIHHAETSYLRHEVKWMAGPSEWLMLQFFGEMRTTASMASATGLAEVGGRRYSPVVLELVGISEDELPAIEREPFRNLRAPWADRWPDLADVPWYPAVGDGACATVGSGGVVSGRAALSIGTSAALRILVDPIPEPPDGLFTYGVTKTAGLVGGASSNAGNLLGWARRVLNLPEDAVQEALSRPRGSHDLLVEPDLAGARSPDWPADATGTISRIRLSTSAIDILQALIETSVEEVGAIVSTLEQWAGTSLQLVASGGVTEDHPLWMGLLANTLRRPIYGAPFMHSGLIGAAILALADMGVVLDPPALGEPIALPVD